MKRLLHPVFALIAKNIEANTVCAEVWEETQARTREEDEEIMANSLYELEQQTKMVKILEVAKSSLEAYKINPMEAIVTGDFALYMHGLIPECPAQIDLFLKRNLYEKYIRNRKFSGYQLDVNIHALDSVLDTEPMRGVRILTLDQILKTLKENTNVDQANEMIETIRKRMEARTHARDLTCVKRADRKATAKTKKPKRHEVNGEHKRGYNSYWEDRKDSPKPYRPRHRDKYRD